MDEKRIKLRIVILCFIFVAGKISAQTPPPAVPAVITNIYEPVGSVGSVSWTGTTIIDAEVGKYGGPPPNLLNRSSALNIDIAVNDGGIVYFDYIAIRASNEPFVYSFDITIFPPTPQTPALLLSSYEPPSFPLVNSAQRFTADLSGWRNQTVTIQFVTSYGFPSTTIINGEQARATITGLQLATCPVAPLMPLTDPDAMAFENGNTVNTNPPFNLGAELSCLTSRVGTAGGSSTLTSAYRPTQYQQHLREVFFAQRALQNLRTQECAVLKAEVQAESNQHGIIRAPAVSSNHSRGRAFDLAITGLTSAQIDAEATACGLRRFDPIGDPVHFTR